LLVLLHNPLEDITAYEDIELVVQYGRILDIGFHYDFANPVPLASDKLYSLYLCRAG